MVEFLSPLYLANICLKNGINQNDNQIKRFGLLEKSYDFKLFTNQRPVKFQHEELFKAQNTSMISADASVNISSRDMLFDSTINKSEGMASNLGNSSIGSPASGSANIKKFYPKNRGERMEEELENCERVVRKSSAC